MSSQVHGGLKRTRFFFFFFFFFLFSFVEISSSRQKKGLSRKRKTQRYLGKLIDEESVVWIVVIVDILVEPLGYPLDSFLAQNTVQLVHLEFSHG